jgi:hypothetical protein
MTRAHSTAARSDQPRMKSRENHGRVHDDISHRFGHGNGADPGTSRASIPYVADLARDVEGQASRARQGNRQCRLSGSRPPEDHVSTPTDVESTTSGGQHADGIGWEEHGRAAERGCSEAGGIQTNPTGVSLTESARCDREGYQDWASTRRVWRLASTPAELRPSVGPYFGRGGLSGEKSDLTSPSSSNRAVRFRSRDIAVSALVRTSDLIPVRSTGLGHRNESD